MTAEEKPQIGCHCPYCDEEVGEAYPPYCHVCRLDLVYCPECQKPVKSESRECPNCGAAIKG